MFALYGRSGIRLARPCDFPSRRLISAPARSRLAQAPRPLAPAAIPSVLGVLSLTLFALPVHTQELPETLVIATFNAEWLFDGVDDNARSPWRDRPAEARAHMEDVADVIRAIDADVVGLVEVESLEVLEQLNADFLTGLGYTAHLIQGRDTYTQQDVGLLTRIPPETPLARTDDRIDYPVPESEIDVSVSGSTGVSKHYYTILSVGDLRFALVGIHFLARPTQRSRAVKREAQAEVIRRLARREGVNQGAEVIILGDVNDYDVFPDAAGSEPISQVLALLKDVDPAHPGADLVNVAEELPIGERYSAWWDRDDDGNFEIDRGEATLIDHILVSENLAGRVDSVWFYREYAPGSVSDHWPLVVRLNLGDEAPSGEAVHTGTVVSNALGEVRPLGTGVQFYLMLPTGTHAVLSSSPEDPAEYLDLRDWLGRRVSILGNLEDGMIYSARLAGGE